MDQLCTNVEYYHHQNQVLTLIYQMVASHYFVCTSIGRIKEHSRSFSKNKDFLWVFFNSQKKLLKERTDDGLTSCPYQKYIYIYISSDFALNFPAFEDKYILIYSSRSKLEGYIVRGYFA